MSDDLRRQIYLNFSQRETEELLEIWRTNDHHEWSDMTFDVVREILQERHIEPPPQGQPVYEAQPKTQISSTWFREMKPTTAAQAIQKENPGSQKTRLPTWLPELSPDRWVKRYTFRTLAVSFALSLLASWLVYNLVLWLQEPDYPFDPFPNVMYAMSCLPVQALVLFVGAVIGARSASTQEARWRQATLGVWIVGVAAILLAILGAGVLPKSGS